MQDLPRQTTTLNKYRVIASAAIALTGSAVTLTAHAGAPVALPVQVTITGEVEFNQVNPANSRLGNVNTGDDFTLTFVLDPNNFTDSTNFPTRGYALAPGSLTLEIGSETFGLLDPLGTETPLFVIRNDDPAVDGFFLGSSVDGFNDGVALDEPGGFGAFRYNFSVGYNNDPLPSLDIIDAQGTYDFTGLTSFNTTIDDGPFNPVGMIFEQMTIEVIPEPSSLTLLGGAGLVLLRRRRHG